MARTATSQRRTGLVLTSLLAAMTFSAGLLLALEASPIAPSSSATLLSTQSTGDARKELFDPSAQLGWQRIVIHDSGSLQGSLSSLNKVHEKLGLGGLGYHFVIDNGQGAPDGLIEVGFRWKNQRIGAHSKG